MSALAARPPGDATAAHVREPDSVAALTRAHEVARQLEAELARAVALAVDLQQVLVALIQAADGLDPRKREEPEACNLGLPQSRDSSTALGTNPAFPGAGNPHLPGEGAGALRGGEDQCGL